MFKKLFSKKNQEVKALTITLNARLQPAHRADLEEALDKILDHYKIGYINGGGSSLSGNEVRECDIEISANDISDKAVGTIIEFLNTVLAPKGSRISVDGRTIPFGRHEGMALYLNGTDLPAEVYKTSDIQVVWDEIEKALGDEGGIHSYYEGPEETVLYLYGNSFSTMRNMILPFINDYPLCQRCRIEQIA